MYSVSWFRDSISSPRGVVTSVITTGGSVIFFLDILFSASLTFKFYIHLFGTVLVFVFEAGIHSVDQTDLKPRASLMGN